MKNIILSTLVVLSFGFNLSASEKSECTLTQNGPIEVSWIGYKTPKKVGVGGAFDKVTYVSVATSGKNLHSILVGSSVVIDASSVNSKHEDRDAKLAQFFFGLMSDKNINAKIVSIQADKKIKDAPKTGLVNVEITMNGVKKTTAMTYSFSDDVLEAKGSIDILDFSADKALAGINEACYDLHEGKTWSDVGIAFKTKIAATLCDTKTIN